MQPSIFSCWCRPCLFLSLVLSSTSCEDSCFPSYSPLTAPLKQTIHILPVKQLFCPSMLIIRIIWHQQVGVGMFLQLPSVTHTVYNTIATHILGRLCYRYLLARSLSELKSDNSYRWIVVSHPVYGNHPWAFLLLSKCEGIWSSLPQMDTLMQITTCHKL